MREKLRDSGRLEHIIEAIDNAFEFTDGVSYEEFFSNKMMRYAVARSLQIVGEASYKLTKELRAQYPEIEWRDIISMRHILVHGYYHISDEVVWDTVMNYLPQFKEQIIRIMDNNIKN